MELYIRIKDGQPFEHPILGDNFREAFPDIDVNNLPPEFARFERIAPPSVIGVYEVYEGVTYEWIDGVVKDVHHMRSFTEEEKLAHQNSVKEMWAKDGFPSWTYNEEINDYGPPIPRPKDGFEYMWDEVAFSWVRLVESE
jgi:hypothetical protein